MFICNTVLRVTWTKRETMSDGITMEAEIDLGIASGAVSARGTTWRYSSAVTGVSPIGTCLD
jgi:hypothetical protein